MLFSKFDIILMSISYSKCAPADGEELAIPAVSTINETHSHHIPNPVTDNGNSPSFKETAADALKKTQNPHNVDENNQESNNQQRNDLEKLKNEAAKQHAAEVGKLINEINTFVKNISEEYKEVLESCLKMSAIADDKSEKLHKIDESSVIQSKEIASEEGKIIFKSLEYKILQFEAKKRPICFLKN
ncbi:hypothetical protein ENBRE01_3310 [Enteropsectra breve]|nr:hypothetical protein ENBRE01_2799 [Enteropsectra breve]KAI5154182.1 hypothetical protein ENBRE01_3310 [Enteropsectra breve]